MAAVWVVGRVPGCKREIDAGRAGSDGGLRFGDRHLVRLLYVAAGV